MSSLNDFRYPDVLAHARAGNWDELREISQHDNSFLKGKSFEDWQRDLRAWIASQDPTWRDPALGPNDSIELGAPVMSPAGVAVVTALGARVGEHFTQGSVRTMDGIERHYSLDKLTPLAPASASVWQRVSRDQARDWAQTAREAQALLEDIEGLIELDRITRYRKTDAQLICTRLEAALHAPGDAVTVDRATPAHLRALIRVSESLAANLVPDAARSPAWKRCRDDLGVPDYPCASVACPSIAATEGWEIVELQGDDLDNGLRIIRATPDSEFVNDTEALCHVTGSARLASRPHQLALDRLAGKPERAALLDHCRQAHDTVATWPDWKRDTRQPTPSFSRAPSL